jgi:hypothetical protein
MTMRAEAPTDQKEDDNLAQEASLEAAEAATPYLKHWNTSVLQGRLQTHSVHSVQI